MSFRGSRATEEYQGGVVDKPHHPETLHQAQGDMNGRQVDNRFT